MDLLFGRIVEYLADFSGDSGFGNTRFNCMFGQNGYYLIEM